MFTQSLQPERAAFQTPAELSLDKGRERIGSVSLAIPQGQVKGILACKHRLYHDFQLKHGFSIFHLRDFKNIRSQAGTMSQSVISLPPSMKT